MTDVQRRTRGADQPLRPDPALHDPPVPAPTRTPVRTGRCSSRSSPTATGPAPGTATSRGTSTWTATTRPTPASRRCWPNRTGPSSKASSRPSSRSVLTQELHLSFDRVAVAYRRAMARLRQAGSAAPAPGTSSGRQRRHRRRHRAPELRGGTTVKVSEIPGLRDQWYAVARAEDVHAGRPLGVQLFGPGLHAVGTGQRASRAHRGALPSPRCPTGRRHHRGRPPGVLLPRLAVRPVGDVRCASRSSSRACPYPPRPGPARGRWSSATGCAGPASANRRPTARRRGTRPTSSVGACRSTSSSRGRPVRCASSTTTSTCPTRRSCTRAPSGTQRARLVPRTSSSARPRAFGPRCPRTWAASGPKWATADEGRRYERTQETELLSPVQTRIRLSYGGAAADYCLLRLGHPARRRALAVRAGLGPGRHRGRAALRDVLGVLAAGHDRGQGRARRDQPGLPRGRDHRGPPPLRQGDPGVPAPAGPTGWPRPSERTGRARRRTCGSPIG